MNEDLTTHDLIILTLKKYYEANQKWETRHTDVSALEIRKSLSELRRLAGIRRKEVQDVKKNKVKRTGVGQTRETLRSTIDREE